MKFTPLVGGNMSGSMGAVTASRNRYGSYFRQKVVPVDPASDLQASRRNVFGQAVRRWIEVLTDEQRSAWNTYATNVPVINSAGQSITLTGQAMYIRCQSFRAMCGKAVLADAPTTYDLGSFTPISGVTVNDSMELAFTFTPADSWAIAVGGALAMFCGPQQNPSRGFFKGPYRLVTLISGAVSPPTSPAAMTVEAPRTQNNLTWLYYRVMQPDGRLSNIVRVGPIVIESAA